jgi:hypothetical protein
VVLKKLLIRAVPHLVVNASGQMMSEMPNRIELVLLILGEGVVEENSHFRQQSLNQLNSLHMSIVTKFDIVDVNSKLLAGYSARLPFPPERIST